MSSFSLIFLRLILLLKTAKEFVDQFVKALRARVLIAGFDYSFGFDKKTVS